MARPCGVCSHAQREQIDLELVNGGALRTTGAKWSVSRDSIRRHFAHHLRPGVARVQAAVQARTERQQTHELDVLGELRGRLERADRLVGIAEGLVGRAAQREDWRTAVAGVSAATRALGESRACLELLARLLGEVPTDTTTVNVSLHAEWPLLRQNIVRALEPYPEARLRVLESLNGHAGG